MRRLALLTPDPGERRYEGRWQAAAERLAPAFAHHGVELAPSPWTAPPPAGVEAALVQLSWGYHLRPDDWQARLEGGGPPLINPAPVLRWNTWKTYLLELADLGAPVVPTRAVDAVTPLALEQAFSAFGTEMLVVKPQVSAGAHLTLKLARGQAAEGLPPGPALIQPFLPAVGGEGELSLFYFGGRLSHAVRKVAAAGDFRIQPQYGGRLTPFSPDPEALAAAQTVLEAGPGPIAYCRVDLIRGLDGRLALMELEAIEPDLYLDLVPEAADRFAAAVVAAMPGG